MLAVPGPTADLTVTIAGVVSDEGNVVIAMYDQPAEFPQGKPMRGEIIAAAAGIVTVVFKEVLPGRYALSAFHDINANGKLDTNTFGIPIEPYGASRDARCEYGPPSFEDASFVVGTEPVNLSINIT